MVPCGLRWRFWPTPCLSRVNGFSSLQGFNDQLCHTVRKQVALWQQLSVPVKEAKRIVDHRWLLSVTVSEVFRLGASCLPGAREALLYVYKPSPGLYKLPMQRDYGGAQLLTVHPQWRCRHGCWAFLPLPFSHVWSRVCLLKLFTFIFEIRSL